MVMRGDVDVVVGEGVVTVGDVDVTVGVCPMQPENVMVETAIRMVYITLNLFIKAVNNPPCIVTIFYGNK